MGYSKECKLCKKVKDESEFSKRAASRDGLQLRCKVCNAKDNKKFRTEKPEHHAQWQIANSDKVVKIVGRYRKADKSGKIYFIVNPDNQFYIGMTMMHLPVRLIEHKVKFRRWKEGKKIRLQPKLFESFEKWGWDAHRKGILIEFENIDRKALREIEKRCIQTFTDLGISLNANK